LDPVTPRPTPPRGGAPAASLKAVDAPIAASRPALRPRPGPDLLEETVAPVAARSAFLAAFELADGESKIVRDVAGEELAIGPALFQAAGRPARLAATPRRVLPLVAKALRDPDEIWWVWRLIPGRPAQLMRRY